MNQNNKEKSTECEHQGKCYRESGSVSATPFGYCKHTPKQEKEEVKGKNLIVCPIHGNEEYEIEPPHYCRFKINEGCNCKCVCPTFKNKVNYSHVSHFHCWQRKNLSCGIPLEKHTQCCLCDLKPPEKEEDRCKHGIDGTDCFECYPTKKEEVMSADKGEGKLPSERITEIFKERCKKYGKDEVGWTSGIIFIEAILKYLDEQSKLSTKI